VTTPGFDRHPACRITLIHKSLDGRDDHGQPGGIWAALGWRHVRECATGLCAAGSIDLTWR
jgi:hypothetical protein